MLGVTFGIAMFIVMISFMQGVNQFLEDSALDASPHVRIYNEVNTQRASILDAVDTADGWQILCITKSLSNNSPVSRTAFK